MITFRGNDNRGQTKLDWLDSRHTFSFGDYHDPRNMGFRDLRVINEDRVSPGKGFGTHSHRDMEIITYVLEGSVEHKDSTGNQTIIRPGDVQRMSAGTGISHSEYNPSKTEPVHFLQIWILPQQQNLPPSYEQRTFDLEKNRGRWLLIASQDGRDGAVTVHQDVALSVARLHAGQQATYRLKPGRHAWLQAARGSVTLKGAALNEGDGAAASGEEILEVRAVEDAEVLIFDLA
jgi:redox-sensitive bicupin YhaK (pirin superfamily)